MRKVDYIIVGLGLAGLAFSRELEKNGKSFLIYENDSQHSSKVAGGMYNPVILKRFTAVWDAEKQLNIAIPFYKELEVLLKGKYDYELAVCRLFTSIEEQNNWFAKCDQPVLSKFMIPKIDSKQYNGIDAEFGYGKVQGTGRIDTKTLLENYRAYLGERDLLIKESFNYDRIKFCKESIGYNAIEAEKIVFCEGFGIKKNPFFNYLPLQEAKGEIITIYAPQLQIDFVLKSSVFIMPLGEHLFKVGATFKWSDKTSIPTEEAKEELLEKLNKLITVPFKVVDHVAGIRPSIKDRRPLVGVHPKKPQLAILNGLGTRGVMIAPAVAEELYNHIENNGVLRKEIDISRFEPKYFT
jgi:glycine oxidase